jgi:hypothetical protein
MKDIVKSASMVVVVSIGILSRVSCESPPTSASNVLTPDQTINTEETTGPRPPSVIFAADATDAERALSPNRHADLHGRQNHSCFLPTETLIELQSPPEVVIGEEEPEAFVRIALKMIPEGAEGSCQETVGWVRRSKATLDAGTSDEGIQTVEKSAPRMNVGPFVQAFRDCTRGSSYVFAPGQCGEPMDCSSAISSTYRRMGLNMNGTQPDLDTTHFSSCSGMPLQPGDHILVAAVCGGEYPRAHWYTLVEVNDDRNAFSLQNKIIDQSSDCNGLCDVAPLRRSLPVDRKICACARRKSWAKQ